VYCFLNPFLFPEGVTTRPEEGNEGTGFQVHYTSVTLAQEAAGLQQRYGDNRSGQWATIPKRVVVCVSQQAPRSTIPEESHDEPGRFWDIAEIAEGDPT
jgi:hypothetical protein